MHKLLTTFIILVFTFVPVLSTAAEQPEDADPVNQIIQDLLADDHLSNTAAAGLINHRTGKEDSEDETASQTDQELIRQIQELQNLIIYLNTQLK